MRLSDGASVSFPSRSLCFCSKQKHSITERNTAQDSLHQHAISEQRAPCLKSPFVGCAKSSIYGPTLILFGQFPRGVENALLQVNPGCPQASGRIPDMWGRCWVHSTLGPLASPSLVWKEVYCPAMPSEEEARASGRYLEHSKRCVNSRGNYVLTRRCTIRLCITSVGVSRPSLPYRNIDNVLHTYLAQVAPSWFRFPLPPTDKKTMLSWGA